MPFNMRLYVFMGSDPENGGLEMNISFGQFVVVDWYDTINHSLVMFKTMVCTRRRQEES